MKNKPINLSVWMFSKAIPSALLLLYYGMCSWGGYDPTLRYLHGFYLSENCLCVNGHCSIGLCIRRFLWDHRWILCCGRHPLVDNR